jgi:hypothetical protein
MAALECITGHLPSTQDRRDLQSIPESDPNALARVLAGLVPGRLAVTGSYERRIVLAQRSPGIGGWVIADLSGEPLATRGWPQWTRDHVQIADPPSWLSLAELTENAVWRVLRPRVLLVALYHPEWFPLPRFPLGISDLARAARETLLGQVSLMDMQLGASLADVEAAIGESSPDIVGVSATFGQHDLTIALLDHLQGLPWSPLVLAGGSLTARNEALLLSRYPDLIVARGAGEATIADTLAFFHGDIRLEDVRGIGYSGADRGNVMSIGKVRRHTVAVPNRALRDFLPELDLLDATFDRHGVAQLETSRGCSSACSFCPRSHKGAWAPGELAALTPMLTAIGNAFDRHPGTSRTVYLVDEEIIGNSPDSEQRILSLASMLAGVGLSWESSCRIDQVVWPGQSREWHVERARMWCQLTQLGLRRMLFGVESGVSSVLERFNKGTTGEQNVLAIRTLSALGVPTRFTYITFDHLMSPAELAATHAFQGRTDLLLRPLPHLSAEQIVDGVNDPAFIAEHQLGKPFYTGISYMLVSMECLIGAAYTRAVQAASLAGAIRPSMGRVDADFADWRIGACSHYAQLWIDRHFSLDYTAKSLEKITDGPARELLYQARVTLRSAAYSVLTRMLATIGNYEGQDGSTAAISRFQNDLQLVLETELANLREVLDRTVSAAAPALPAEPAAYLRDEHRRWAGTRQWRLINAAESSQA